MSIFCTPELKNLVWQVVEVSDSGLEVQEVGSLQGGLLAMAASPDGELLLLVTGAGQLLVMTQDWDQLYEVPLGKDLDTSVSTLRIFSLSLSSLNYNRYLLSLEF